MKIWFSDVAVCKLPFLLAVTTKNKRFPDVSREISKEM